MFRKNAIRIMKPSDGLLPAAFLIAALLGRSTVSLWLFLCYYGVKLCALATSDGLRRAFANQPSMRFVQGSALLALLLQFPGALISALALRLMGFGPGLYALITCGLLLNIEHVFCEYLLAIGDDYSALMYRSITAALTLMGMMFCPPSTVASVLPTAREALWLLGGCSISAVIGLIASLVLGGSLKPRMNAEVLRRFPLSMLQTALYPAAALTAHHFLADTTSPAVPLFAGLILYEVCRSPFRRTSLESRPMNRALLVALIAACLVAAACYTLLGDLVSPVVPLICLCVVLAALCAFALFGSIRRGRREEA